MSLVSRCRHRVTVERNRGTDNGSGGTTEDWRILHVNVPCLVSTTGDVVKLSGGGEAVVKGYAVFIPDVDLDILETDRLVFLGHTLRILTKQNPNFQDRFMRLNCEDW